MGYACNSFFSHSVSHHKFLIGLGLGLYYPQLLHTMPTCVCDLGHNAFSMERVGFSNFMYENFDSLAFLAPHVKFI